MYYYVYVIRSIKYPKTIYVGYTVDIKKRLACHNAGGSVYTKKDKPWELVVCMAFRDIDCAKNFEKYLKSQSGRAFSSLLIQVQESNYDLEAQTFHAHYEARLYTYAEY